MVYNQTGVPFASFAEMTRAATKSDDAPGGLTPYHYQERLAEGGFPDLIEVPTGSGKTLAATLPWVWRRLLHPDQTVRVATPRRLIVALPTRALIDQTEQTIRQWLTNLQLSESTIRMHVMMGGGRLSRHEMQRWRRDMDVSTIVVCTLDMLVSRALMRGYGTYRGSYPIDFALVGNGAQIVVDEIQLVPQATTTLRQLAAFQRRCGTAEPSGLTVMSATVDTRILDTVDNPWDCSTRIVTLQDHDVQGGLARRLAATRTVRRLTDGPPTPKDLAHEVASRHVEGTLTIVVVNTVDLAVETYRALEKSAPAVPRLLIHSRFRGMERAGHMSRLRGLADLDGSGGVVVTTQSIEAGVDIDGRTLVTEAAPWSSIVQRAGRCNRAGRHAGGDATLWWFPSTKSKQQPYAAAELVDAEAGLLDLEGQALTSTQLSEAGATLPTPDLALRMMRWTDFEQLFDTTPDLAGNDIDIGIYIRPDRDLDVQVAWVPDEWAASGKALYPADHLRCAVPVGRVTDFVKQPGVTAWVFDPGVDRWVAAGRRRLQPQDVVLVSASSGGYTPELGFRPNSRKRVETDPSLEVPRADVAAPESGSAAEEPGALGSAWIELTSHLEEAGRHARSLTNALAAPGISPAHCRAVYAAATLHDLGKAHPDWQAALRTANETSPPSHDTAYAKSPGSAALRVVRGDRDGRTIPRTGFRHELVSLFMLVSQGSYDHLIGLQVAPEWHDLVRYLVVSHHGHVRLTARDPQWDGRDGTTLLGCGHDEPTPSWRIGDRELPAGRIDLGIFKTGRQDSWPATAAALLAELGPFRLAYLETLVRMADWRASAGLSVAGDC